MLKNCVMASIVGLTVCANLSAEKLPSFGADLGQKSIMGKTIRFPYTSLVSYWGYVKPGSAPDETVDGKKTYYLYVWIPAVAPELGVRMVSPAAHYGQPAKGDFVAANYKDGAADKDTYFDTWINVERAVSIVNPGDIAAKFHTTSWVSYGRNDDSGELPAQPSGSKYNSLLRITSEPSNPTKALVRGLYRIAFTTFKTGEVQGTFLAQVGAPIKLPGVVISKDIHQVMAAINKK